MIQIKYVTGDATQPRGNGQRVIAHVCNNVGAWGAGFVVALSKRFPYAEEAYRNWWNHSQSRGAGVYMPFHLGSIQVVRVNPTTLVCNMVAQHGLKKIWEGGIPLRYGALEECLERLASFIVAEQALHPEKPYSTHMPRIGCGLAGGNWAQVEPLLLKTLGEKDIPITVYDKA